MNLDDEFWSDPAQWHPDDQIGEGLTERRSHNHEGLTQDILMNEDQNEQPVIGWNAKAGAFSGLGVSWDMLVSGPREAADVGTKPARRNKNVGTPLPSLPKGARLLAMCISLTHPQAEASTSASSSPLRCVQEQGVSKAPSKARTAERPIFGTGSDNPAHRYICETCRKEGYAKCRFRRQDSLDRHQARHIGIYGMPHALYSCDERMDNHFLSFQKANVLIVTKESVARIMHSIISDMHTASISNVTTAIAPNITIILARIREFVSHVPSVERTGNRRERRGKGCGRIHQLRISVVI
ncbi:hypothetical protein FRC20_010019 [Serendipita sp. 405]|nr:hypothetical protein FRC20_010019 [Serendipita sp. 405]